MWQLHMTNSRNEWVHDGDFETVTAAARRIREIEAYPVTSLFFEIQVDTAHGSDEDSFGHLEHNGRRAAYVVKRRMN
jgi:hypothetical protein